MLPSEHLDFCPPNPVSPGDQALILCCRSRVVIVLDPGPANYEKYHFPLPAEDPC